MSEPAVEARIRTTLHRRAADVEVDPPPWEELVGRAGGVVIPLRPTDTGPTPAHLRPTRRRRLPRVSLRPALATAAALLVAFGAAMVVDDRGGVGTGEPPVDDPNDDTVAALNVPDTPVVPSPGSADFVAQLATPLPVDTANSEVSGADTDPTILAQLYLLNGGLGGSTTGRDDFQLQIDPFTTEPVDQIDPLEGSVWWSVWDRSGVRLAIGTVFLRVADPDAAVRTWEVVGAFTSSQGGEGSTSLGAVRRAGGVLAFDVGDYFPNPTARVLVNGVEAHAGRIPDGYKPFTIEDPAPGQVVTIQLQHLEDGAPVSITAMAVAPSDAHGT